MYLNNINLEHYNGNLQMSYKYTPPAPVNEYYQGYRSSNFNLLFTNYGLGELSLPIVFIGDSRRHVTEYKSMFERDAFGQVEIDMEDGYEYSCFLDSIGDMQYQGEQIIECEYKFKCIRHWPLEISQGNSVFCKSTLPNTNCILSATVSTAGSNYQVGPVTFDNVTAGQQITVDGITKRILINGVSNAASAHWMNFPSLVPGENAFACDDTLTIQYYPSFF